MVQQFAKVPHDSHHLHSIVAPLLLEVQMEVRQCPLLRAAKDLKVSLLGMECCGEKR